MLLVSMGSWMRNGEGAGYRGATEVLPANMAAIREFRPTEDFEGRARGRSGLDRTRSFVMTMLDGPPRPVVDIAG